MRLLRPVAAAVAFSFVALSSCNEGVTPPTVRARAVSVDAQNALAPIRISEFHYDNTGTDAGEAIEVSFPTGSSLTGYTIVLYNGDPSPTTGLRPYGGAARALTSGTVTACTDSRSVVVLTYAVNGIQNGNPDGLALISPSGGVVEFISYGGAFTAITGAAGGPAAGMTSVNIGVTEPSTAPVGVSLQLQSSGIWSPPTPNTFGTCNDDDTPPPTPVFTSIKFDPQTVSLGGTKQLVATALDQFNAPMSPQPTFTWADPPGGALTVDPVSGIATGLSLGAENVQVSAAGPSGPISRMAFVTVAAIPNLTITELFGNPSAVNDNVGEWIEIYNGEPTPVNLAGYQLVSNGSPLDQHTIGALIIAPGACAVLGNSADPAVNGGIPVNYSYGGGINLNNNNSDWIIIKTPDGAVADSVAYAIRPDGVNPNSFSPFSASGISYELAFLALDNTTVEGGNWSQSSNEFNTTVRGTPGTCPPATQVFTSVSIAAASVDLGGTKQLVATARDQNGNAMFVQPTFTWASLNEAVLTIDANTGVATGVALGAATVNASSGGITGSRTINVVDPNAVATLTLVNGAVFNLPAGYSAPLFPTARRSDGSVISNAPLTYSTSDAAVATVSGLGYVSSLSPGPVTITATAASGVSASVNFTISPHSVPTSAIYRPNLTFGQPSPGTGANDVVIEKPQYSYSYNASRGGPNWVAFDLNATHFGPTPRCNCFTPDPDLPVGTYRVVDFDYRNGGFDRGHMAMSEERTATLQENAVSFLLTNVLPQANANNAGPWLRLEEHLNAIAQGGREVYVVAGGLYPASPKFLKSEGKVAIPTSTWKVALILNSGVTLADVHSLADVEAIAINIPNTAPGDSTPITGISGNSWETYKTTVAAIEAATGYNFLSLLTDEIEIPLEHNDRPPVANAGGAYSGAEGSAVLFNGGASSDPDVGDAVVSYVWTFGDGSTVTTAAPTVSHAYANDGSYSVTLTVYDNVGAFHSTTTSASIANVAPFVSAFADATLLLGETYTASGTFSDPVDALTASVNYGDGSGAQPIAGSPFNLSRTYAAAGTYTVTVSVTDDDVTSTSSATVVVLSAAQAIANIATTIDGMSLNGGNANSLKSKLNAALNQIQNGNLTPARNQLNALLNEIDAMQQSSKISAADAAALTAAVNRLLATL